MRFVKTFWCTLVGKDHDMKAHLPMKSYFSLFTTEEEKKEQEKKVMIFVSKSWLQFSV